MRINNAQNVTVTAGNLVIGTSGKGIDFSGVGTAAEILDDYEEGTFTPVVRDGVSGNAATQVTLAARYTKVGRIVYFKMSFLNINTTGLTAGNRIFVTGMPFTQATSTNGGAVFLVGKSQITSTAGVISAFFSNNTTYMGLSNEITTAAAVSEALVSQMTSTNADLYISGVYEAA
jgi:hypothetical protein